MLKFTIVLVPEDMVPGIPIMLEGINSVFIEFQTK